MLLAVSKGKKSRFYLKKIRPVQEDDNNYYFLQDETMYLRVLRYRNNTTKERVFIVQLKYQKLQRAIPKVA